MTSVHKSLVPPIPAASKEAAMDNVKKLRLNRETIRNLSDENLTQVAGGKRKDGGQSFALATIGVGVCVSNANACISEVKFSGCVALTC
jgi:hypothetical protein